MNIPFPPDVEAMAAPAVETPKKPDKTCNAWPGPRRHISPRSNQFSRCFWTAWSILPIRTWRSITWSAMLMQ